MSQVRLRLTGKAVADHTTTRDFQFSSQPETGYYPLIDGPVVLSRRINGVRDCLASLSISDVAISGVDVVADWWSYSFIGAAAELDYAGTTYALVVSSVEYADNRARVTFSDYSEILNGDIELDTVASSSTYDPGLVLPRLYGQVYNISGKPYSRLSLGALVGMWVSDNTAWEATACYHGGYELNLNTISGNDFTRFSFNWEFIAQQYVGGGSEWAFDTGDWSVSFSGNTVTYSGTVGLDDENRIKIDDWDANQNYKAKVIIGDNAFSSSTPYFVAVGWGNSTGHARKVQPDSLGDIEAVFELDTLAASSYRSDYLRLTWENLADLAVVVFLYRTLDKPLTIDIRETTAANRQATNVAQALIEERLAAAKIGDVLAGDTADAGVYITDRTNLLSVLSEYFQCGFFYGVNRAGEFELKELNTPATSTKTIHRAKTGSYAARQAGHIFTSVRVGYKENHTPLRQNEFHQGRGPDADAAALMDTPFLKERFFNVAEAVSANAGNFSDLAYMPETFPSFYSGATKPQAHADRIIDLWGVPRWIHTFDVVEETLDYDVGDTISMTGFGDDRDDDYVVWGWEVECLSDTMRVDLLK